MASVAVGVASAFETENTKHSRGENILITLWNIKAFDLSLNRDLRSAMNNISWFKSFYHLLIPPQKHVSSLQNYKSVFKTCTHQNAQDANSGLRACSYALRLQIGSLAARLCRLNMLRYYRSIKENIPANNDIPVILKTILIYRCSPRCFCKCGRHYSEFKIPEFFCWYPVSAYSSKTHQSWTLDTSLKKSWMMHLSVEVHRSKLYFECILLL